ncbi:bifunctional riboflavin kinase/FAD synthetase [Prosthecochloris vibrioformis]|uniref:Riboflavin biosynthesis protein n=1 Tax=Prosthecochloris vibrioformis TaxID=1098 RepID=A0A5C4S094_PROVB|nr:bifunctional riboflavin kinase/FAD synthetase [Prosthecochloris vibrioformis]TNJ36618.1 bifunctional riboflavin kinase/FAD synthetase [Prosthecochloris vibrioformis]
MQVVRYHNGTLATDGCPFAPAPSVVTVGSYDGVHMGHRKIIARMQESAREQGWRSVVVTFDPHPRKVVKDGEGVPGLLTLPEEKERLLGELGIDILFVISFDEEFARRSSEWFIDELLVAVIGARRMVIGYDHGFGSGRKGSRDTLKAMAERDGFTVEVVEEVRLQSQHFSSTRIRSLLSEGRVREANLFLGASYMVSGEVVHGRALGRKLGFPTVNLALSSQEKLLPKSGVYASLVEVDGVERVAMMNIGQRPTLDDGRPVTIEAHILGHEGDLYGRNLVFRLLERLRDEERFPSLEALRAQLEEDKKMMEKFRK